MGSLEIPPSHPIIPIAIFPPPADPPVCADNEHKFGVWPPLAPAPDMSKRGFTEARCVHDLYYGETSDQRLDALKHLISICMKKCGNLFWKPQPALRFVGARTWDKDWENVLPDGRTRHNTRGWFQIILVAIIDKYSPTYITRRELHELIRLKDPDLLHVCNAAVGDLKNEVTRQMKKPEPHWATIWELDGDSYFWDEKKQIAVPLDDHVKPCPPDPVNKFREVLDSFIKDRQLRVAIPERPRRTAELVLRKLAQGVPGERVISEVADDLGKNKRTVKRYLQAVRRICDSMDRTVSSFIYEAIVPGEPTPPRPTL